MNKKQKSLTNKGFSLVELIIVIAIMAVLIGVLAPQYLKYVESSRLQKDNQAIAEIANSIKIAMADETINSSIANSASESFSVASGTTTYNFPATGATGATQLSAELNTVVGASVKLTSNTYSSTAPTITVSKDDKGMVTVSATNYVAKAGAAAGTQNF